MLNKLVLDAVRAFGENFNEIVILFLLLSTVFFYVKYDLLKLSSIRGSMRKLNVGIAAINGYDSHNIWKVDSLFSEKMSSGLKIAWAACYYDFKYVLNKERMPDIKEYFNLSSIITLPAARKKAESVPGILTAAGIAGTFLFILSGFSDFISTPALQTDDRIIRLLDILFPAISMFITALILSAAFRILDRQAYHCTFSELDQLIGNLSRKIPMATEKERLEQLIVEQRLTREAIDKMGINISAQLAGFIGKEMVPSIHKAFEEAINNQVVPSIKSMSDQLYQLSEAASITQSKGMQTLVDHFIDRLITVMGVELQKLGSDIRGISDYSSRAAENINGLINRLSANAELQGEVNAQTVKVLETIGCYQHQLADIHSALATNMERMKSYNEAMQSILISDRQAAEELDSQRQGLAKESREYFNKMDEQISRLLEETNVQLDAAFSRFNDITSIAFERLDQSLGSTMEGVAENMKALTDNMDDQVRDISLYARSISEEVGELNNRLENSVREFGSKMNEGVGKIIEDFDNGLSEICSRLGSVISNLNDAVEELPSIIRAMESYKSDNQGMVG